MDIVDLTASSPRPPRPETAAGSPATPLTLSPGTRGRTKRTLSTSRESKSTEETPSPTLSSSTTSKKGSKNVFASQEYPGLNIDPTQEGTLTSLLNIRDFYAEEFFPHANHVNFVSKDLTEPFVLSVLSTWWSPDNYDVLVTTSSRSIHASLSLPQPKGITATEELPLNRIIQALEDKENVPAMTSKDLLQVPATATEFPKQLLTIEEKHPQRRTQMKIGLIYCKRKQTQGPEMFSNTEPSQHFWEFVNQLGDKISLEGWNKYRGDMRPPGTAWYRKWEHLEIIYHVAPILNQEERRRLIGNDICLFFYFDEPYDKSRHRFDASGIDTFGEVPSVFAVIQPNNAGTLYQVGFFSKRNMIPHEPHAPSTPLNFQETQKWVLTKLHNGLTNTIYCSPMSRLFRLPRKDSLVELIKQKAGLNQHYASLEDSEKKQKKHVPQVKVEAADKKKVKDKNAPPVAQAFGSYIVVQQFYHMHNKHDINAMMIFVHDDIHIYFDEVGSPGDNISGSSAAKTLFSSWFKDGAIAFATVLVTTTVHNQTKTKALRFEVVDLKIISIAEIPFDDLQQKSPRSLLAESASPRDNVGSRTPRSMVPSDSSY